ncbi:hypothetical protein D5S17_25275 [Pseudonocardiaceae bacterium YIM PH 21723]|nr:hypothetical protein D5S17_25275 [Pseudonocardiaceae bacterium YIM PH 21723]
MTNPDFSRECERPRCGGQAVRVRFKDNKGTKSGAKLLAKIQEHVRSSAYWMTVGLAAIMAAEERGIYKIFQCRNCHHIQLSVF